MILPKKKRVETRFRQREWCVKSTRRAQQLGKCSVQPFSASESQKACGGARNAASGVGSGCFINDSCETLRRVCAHANAWSRVGCKQGSDQSVEDPVRAAVLIRLFTQKSAGLGTKEGNPFFRAGTP